MSFPKPGGKTRHGFDYAALSGQKKPEVESKKPEEKKGNDESADKPDDKIRTHAQWEAPLSVAEKESLEVPKCRTLETARDFEKKIDMETVRAHNKPEDAWCAINDGVYDISKFASAHPGGDIILLGAGKDATILFETYHVRCGVAEAVLKKYRIGALAGGSRASATDGKVQSDLHHTATNSYYNFESEFYKTLRTRVTARLKERGIERRGGVEIWTKAIFLLGGFWISLYLMCTLDPNGGAIAASAMLGMFAAFVGTCIQHDGNHGAFAYSRVLNKMAGWTLDMIGASAMTWEMQHVLGHHPYTNLIESTNGNFQQSEDQESDPDVFSSFPTVRLHPWQKRSWYHRFQHMYAPFLFGLMTLAKVFQQDFGLALQKRLFHIDANCRYASPWYVARFWAMKVVTAFYMIVIPFYFHGPWHGIKLFLLAHFCCGEILATMFIVNHIIEGVSYASKDIVNGSIQPPRTLRGVTPMLSTQKTVTKSKKTVPLNDWAAVQCQTSVNWAAGSWFWNHFSGGLNHQIEHHLFPGVTHTAYFYIQDVVQSTCEEYGVPYQTEPSLWSAYWKMLAHLKELGKANSTPIWDAESKMKAQ